MTGRRSKLRTHATAPAYRRKQREFETKARRAEKQDRRRNVKVTTDPKLREYHVDDLAEIVAPDGNSLGTIRRPGAGELPTMGVAQSAIDPLGGEPGSYVRITQGRIEPGTEVVIFPLVRWPE